MKTFDVWRTVDLLTANFGAEAELIASQLAEAWETEGDETMNTIWNKVSYAIRDLRRNRRNRDETVN